jgi:RND family efflux transporter MFP subunit
MRPARTALATLTALIAAAWLPAHALPASQCLIEPLQKVELRSPVSAPIAVVHVERGSPVRKGQLLVSLDAAVEQAALEVSRYRSVMEGAVRAAESRLQNATEKLRRRNELLVESFVSAQDRDDAAAEARAAEADLLQARDNRELARLEARQLTASVGRYSIYSPIDGVVVDRLQNPGELTQTGDAATAVLKLAQTDPLRVEVVLSVAEYGKVKPGRSVDIRPEAPFTGVYRATVKIVDKVVDSASGTFRVRLELPNPRGDIPAGVKCVAGL